MAHGSTPVDEIRDQRSDSDAGEGTRTAEAPRREEKAADPPASYEAAPTWSGPDAQDVRCETEGVLPAGFYRGGVRLSGVEIPVQLDCPEPTHVVSAVFRRARDAEDALREEGRAGLAPGYPWVPVARHPGSRIVVVVGQFASRSAAEAWLAARRRDGHLGRRWRVRAWNAESSEEERPTIVHVERPTTAYSEHTASSIASRYDPEELEEAPGACSIEADSIFFFPLPERHPKAPPPERSPVFLERNFQPVRCENGDEAWVPLERTRTRSIVYEGRDGRTYVRQVMALSCGEPLVTTWTRTPAGREAPRTERTECHTGFQVSP